MQSTYADSSKLSRSTDGVGGKLVPRERQCVEVTKTREQSFRQL